MLVKANMNRVAFLIFLVHIVFARNLPEGIQKCKRNDDECFSKTIGFVLHNFPKGIPELGVPSLDPITAPYMKISTGKSALQLTQIYNDVILNGYSQNVTGVKASFNDDTKTFKMDVVVSLLEMLAKYDLDGKILMMPIKGHGNLSIKMYNITVGSTIQFKEVEKKGKMYLTVADYKVLLTAQKLIFDLDNLFNGNKELGNVFLRTLNDNWDVVFNEAKDGYEESFAAVYKNIVNQFVNKMPVDELFLPD